MTQRQNRKVEEEWILIDSNDALKQIKSIEKDIFPQERLNYKDSLVMNKRLFKIEKL